MRFAAAASAAIADVLWAVIVVAETCGGAGAELGGLENDAGAGEVAGLVDGTTDAASDGQELIWGFHGSMEERVRWIPVDWDHFRISNFDWGRKPGPAEGPRPDWRSTTNEEFPGPAKAGTTNEDFEGPSSPRFGATSVDGDAGCGSGTRGIAAEAGQGSSFHGG